MTINLVIGNPEWLWPALGVGVALLVLLLYREWGNREIGALPSRIAAALLAVASLVMLALEPAVEREREGGSGILLTDGFQEWQVDSLKEAYPGIRTYRYIKGKSLPVPGSLRKLFVLGYGPEPYDRWQFDSLGIVFPGVEPPVGFTELAYPGQVQLDQELHVRVHYRNSGGGHHLLLRDPGGNSADSIRLGGASEGTYELRTVPKAVGDFRYSLAARDSAGQVLQEGPLPVRVRPRNTMRVLVLNDFPTFETRYLKNFLADSGHELLVRSQITRNRYKFEFINRDPDPIYALTDDILSGFDLVIADRAAYTGLSAASRGALETRISEGGLGLFIQPDDAYFRLPRRLALFDFDRNPDPGSLPGSASGPEIKKYPYTLTGPFTARGIEWSPGVSVGVVRPYGLGRVATTWLRETYPLVLSGQEDRYRLLWASLLNEVVQGRQQTAAWDAQTTIPRVDEPFRFRLRTAGEVPQVVNSGGARVPLRQNVLIPTKWEGTDYPVKTGWNPLRLPADSLPGFRYYVFEEGDWHTVAASRRLVANRIAFQGEEQVSTTVTEYVPVSPLWFYAVFLLGMGWLWLAPRVL
ncbi:MULTISPECIES: hypothetical protein [unclassified Robiginitalea]|uniref:hypothetical protein n=1 Tax=Robiginitalea TaxID=252306 RepID=UPI00234B5A6A|nr:MULTISPECIES: hypothetical protein [unclassified Robiginitalea]MDC6355690.1 hypothetical protein [Robiginitalea sp. PM2]MDC6376107.1 hypothetical protein [Robiginitalea sp. SP8]